MEKKYAYEIAAMNMNASAQTSLVSVSSRQKAKQAQTARDTIQENKQKAEQEQRALKAAEKAKRTLRQTIILTKGTCMVLMFFGCVF